MPEIIGKYKTIASKAEGIYKEKGSRFIAIAIPVSNENEVKDVLENLRKEYHDARHHCYAYRLGYKKDIFRWNDDGEPSGTAGKPIYGQILSYDLTNILIVVIRYFGGILLGTGGLIQAYKAATQNAIENAKIIENNVQKHYKIKFSYEIMSLLMKILKDLNANIYHKDFNNEAILSFSIDVYKVLQVEEQISKLKDIVIIESRIY